MSDIFREIDEELRRDNLLALWKRYGNHLIAAAVVVLIIAGGLAAWRAHQLSVRQAESARFASALALVKAGKTSDAALVFATIANNAGGYGLLASFEEAALPAASGDHRKSAAAYDRMAEDSSVSPLFRGLATLLAAMQNGDPKTGLARLAPLTAAENPWRPTALALTAASELQLGNNKAALATYKSLADDLTAPRDLRARAAEMVAALGP